MKRLLHLGPVLLSYAAVTCLVIGLLMSAPPAYADPVPPIPNAIFCNGCASSCFKDPISGNCLGSCVPIPGGPVCPQRCGCSGGVILSCKCR